MSTDASTPSELYNCTVTARVTKTTDKDVKAFAYRLTTPDVSVSKSSGADILLRLGLYAFQHGLVSLSTIGYPGTPPAGPAPEPVPSKKRARPAPPPALVKATHSRRPARTSGTGRTMIAGGAAHDAPHSSDEDAAPPPDRIVELDDQAPAEGPGPIGNAPRGTRKGPGPLGRPTRTTGRRAAR